MKSHKKHSMLWVLGFMMFWPSGLIFIYGLGYIYLLSVSTFALPDLIWAQLVIDFVLEAAIGYIGVLASLYILLKEKESWWR